MNLTNVEKINGNFRKWLLTDQDLLTLLISSQWDVERFLEAEQSVCKEIQHLTRRMWKG